jgi:hypothetical protein
MARRNLDFWKFNFVEKNKEGFFCEGSVSCETLPYGSVLGTCLFREVFVLSKEVFCFRDVFI